MELQKVLNDEQIKGVTTTSQYVKVVAGAGSGKTRVLTYRIAYLIEERNVYPLSILGITFTNKAAKEIKDRVCKLVHGAEYMHLSTIHSWCARFLRNNSFEIGYPRNFTILDEEDQLQVMKTIFENEGYPRNDPNIKDCLYWIGNKKTEGIQYEDIKGMHYPNPLYNRFLKYFGLYTEYLAKNAALDFDDLLLKSIQILESNEMIRNSTSSRYSHILVDEFQDINDVQFHLIKLLMNEKTSLYVVGDPDQTIYTWRGANHKIMLNLQEKLRYDYKDCLVENILLVNNYRSSKNILDAANKLIAFNKERIEKDLRAINPNGENISYYNARTKQEEAAYVASTINELLRLKIKKPSDIAILYRSNYLTREIESQLTARRIPYKIFGGMKFYQRKEIKDVLAYITLLDNQNNDIAFERIINVPRRNIGPSSLELIKNEADRASQPLYLFCKESLEDVDLPKTKKNSIYAFIDALDKTREELKNQPSKEYCKIIEDMLTNIGYFAHLDNEKEEERIENVKELISTIRTFFIDNPTGTFSDFVENATLQASSDEINDGEYVSLMTVHIAKGLEYDSVFVYSMCESVFPARRSIEEKKDGIEEERRLAYVAMTRAMNKLYLTSNNDYSHVASTYLTPSRFLEESGVKPKRQTRTYEDRYTDEYINPFKNQVFKPKENKSVFAQTNSNNNSWAVGDRLTHESFGPGVVTKLVSDKIIEVKFDDSTYGTKSLLASHIKLKKLLS